VTQNIWSPTVVTHTVEEKKSSYSSCSFGLSATSQQYFSLRTNQPPAISQQYFSLRTNQHQSSATSQTNRLHRPGEGERQATRLATTAPGRHTRRAAGPTSIQDSAPPAVPRSRSPWDLAAAPLERKKAGRGAARRARRPRSRTHTRGREWLLAAVGGDLGPRRWWSSPAAAPVADLAGRGPHSELSHTRPAAAELPSSSCALLIGGAPLPSLLAARHARTTTSTRGRPARESTRLPASGRCLGKICI
jgi:hypothetical protein